MHWAGSVSVRKVAEQTKSDVTGYQSKIGFLVKTQTLSVSLTVREFYTIFTLVFKSRIGSSSGC